MPKGCYTRKPRFYPLEADSPIDDALTQERLGYAATTVSPGSIDRKVTFLCARCQRPVDRIRYRLGPGALCLSCAHAKDGKAVKHPLKSGYEKVEVPCAGCGKTIKVRKMSLHEGSSCPSCRRKSKVTPNKYIDAEETKRRFGYDGAKVTSKSSDKVVVRCSQCEAVFERIRRNVTEEPVCVGCSYATRDTNPDKRLKTLWERYGTTSITAPPLGKAEEDFGGRIAARVGRGFQTQYTFVGGKSVDFYDPVTQIAVEYCGLYWHHEMSPTPRLRAYHYDKYRMCQAHRIDLITVFEDEWLRRPDAVLDVIAARMGYYTRTVGARKCRVAALSWDVAAAFLETHHVQGASQKSWTARGLYTVNADKEDELVAVMTFGQHHRQGHQDVAVLTRLCYATGTRVIGGAQRLFKAALPSIRARGCSRIVSWSDNRWFAGHVYEKLGFTLEEELGPDYAYVNQKRPRERLSKQSQRKKVTGCPPDMTEREWALERGLVRIWDCGRKRWVLQLGC